MLTVRPPPVYPLPDVDQPLSPSSLRASTSTSYSVSRASPPIVAVCPATFFGPFVQLPPGSRWRRSYSVTGGPVFAGALQFTDRLVGLPSTGDTVGAPGGPGGSSTSVTLTVTAIVAVPPRPSSAFTVNA